MTITYSQKAKLNLEQFQFNIINSSNLTIEKNFGLEIDRIFVCVEQGAVAISLLQALGLSCSNQIIRSNSQGTLSKIFFFDNIFLEIIWSDTSNLRWDSEVAPLSRNRNKLPTAINFEARYNWKQTKAAPFGIGISKKNNNFNNLDINQEIINDLIIDHDIYYAQQNQKNILEPFLFLLSNYLKIQPNSDCFKKAGVTNHPLGVHNITDIQVTMYKGRRRTSRLLNLLNDNNLLTIDYCSQPLLELTFDNGIQGKIFDARPILPLVLRY